MPGWGGVYALPPVGWGHRGDSALVPIPAQLMVDESALGHELKHGIVAWVPVQVITNISINK